MKVSCIRDSQSPQGKCLASAVKIPYRRPWRSQNDEFLLRVSGLCIFIFCPLGSLEIARRLGIQQRSRPISRLGLGVKGQVQSLMKAQMWLMWLLKPCLLFFSSFTGRLHSKSHTWCNVTSHKVLYDFVTDLGVKGQGQGYKNRFLRLLVLFFRIPTETYITKTENKWHDDDAWGFRARRLQRAFCAHENKRDLLVLPLVSDFESKAKSVDKRKIKT